MGITRNSLQAPYLPCISDAASSAPRGFSELSSARLAPGETVCVLKGWDVIWRHCREAIKGSLTPAHARSARALWFRYWFGATLCFSLGPR